MTLPTGGLQVNTVAGAEVLVDGQRVGVRRFDLQRLVERAGSEHLHGSNPNPDRRSG